MMKRFNRRFSVAAFSDERANEQILFGLDCPGCNADPVGSRRARCSIECRTGSDFRIRGAGEISIAGDAPATPTRAQSDPRVSAFGAIAGNWITGKALWLAGGDIGRRAASAGHRCPRLNAKIRVLLLNRSRENEF